MNLKLLGVLALAAASAASADQNPASKACSVHVYPAEGVHSVGEDFDAVHGLDQDLHHYYAVAGRPLGWLSIDRQLELLASLPLGQLAGAGTELPTLHNEPMSRSHALEPQMRAAETGCAVEIYMPQIFLERGGLSNRSLRIFGVARRYEQGKLTHSFSGYAAAPLNGFQLRSPADAAAATHLIEAAYVEAVKTFLHNSTK